jgi:hypothetical protein
MVNPSFTSTLSTPSNISSHFIFSKNIQEREGEKGCGFSKILIISLTGTAVSVLWTTPTAGSDTLTLNSKKKRKTTYLFIKFYRRFLFKK